MTDPTWFDVTRFADEANNLNAQRKMVAIVRLGFDLDLAITECAHRDPTAAATSIDLFDNDGNHLMQIARFTSVSAALGSLPAIMALVPTYSWARSYLIPDHLQHQRISQDFVWGGL